MNSSNTSKSSFRLINLLISAVLLLVGLGLGYWQYKSWFHPQVIAGTAIQKLHLGILGLALLLIAIGIVLLFQSLFSKGTPTLIPLHEDLYDQAKKAIESGDAKEFEKLLEGPGFEQGVTKYTALSIERFEDKPYEGTVQVYMSVLDSGGFYVSQKISKRVPVGGNVLEVLKKIEEKHGGNQAY